MKTEKISFDLIDMMGSDIRVANVARVSNDKWKDETGYSEAEKTDIGLIKYLAKHQHESPFMHVVLTVRITAPIFAARQWFKSNIGAVRNEVSRRYVDSEPTFYMPDVLHMRPSGNIKQGSGVCHTFSNTLLNRVESAIRHSSTTYARLLHIADVAPEEARMVLPQNMMTTWIETGSLLYFMRVFGLRQAGTHAQKAGVQEIAELGKTVLRGIDSIKHSYEMLERYNPRTILEKWVENEEAIENLLNGKE